MPQFPDSHSYEQQLLALQQAVRRSPEAFALPANAMLSSEAKQRMKRALQKERNALSPD